MKVDRLEAIRHHLYAQGASSMDALATMIGVSAATVRRDVQTLEQQGFVSRTHGGVRLIGKADAEVAFEVREQQNLPQKRAIAALAYHLVEPQSSIFLDAGTTVLQLARRLRLEPMPLTVFTNGLRVAQELMGVSKLKVTLIGGQLRSENASLVGPAAEAMLGRLWLDKLFLGANAIGDDACIYSIDAAEASLAERMIARSASTVVLTESGKFGRRATFLVARLVPSMRVITDCGVDPARCRAVRDAGVIVTLADPQSGEAGGRHSP